MFARAPMSCVMDRWKARQKDDALRLKPDETCLGGFSGKPGTVVVHSLANGVPKAVQLLEYGRPVECIGDHRLIGLFVISTN